MGHFKRKPPSIAVRLSCCFLADFVAAPIVRALDRTGHLDSFLWKWSEKRERHAIAKNPFRGYVPGRQDVFVMTYPKSGTNWVLQIVWQLIHHCQRDFDHIHSVVPWPDAVLTSRTMRNYAIPLEKTGDWMNAPERKRIIKTHLNWELVPYSKEARYIAVIRNPKDVFVSAYFFIRDNLLGKATPSMSTMCRVFTAGKSPAGGSWAANAAGYWSQRHRENVLILSFASMKRDLEGTVRRIALFLDVHTSDEVIQEVCRRASFEYMKSIDRRFAPYRGAPWRKRTWMMRKGEEGRSSELLTPAQQAQIDASCRAELQRAGSDLPYDYFCGRLHEEADNSRGGCENSWLSYSVCEA
jgi:hypothetical protein